MVVIFTKNDNTVEIKYAMIDRPLRMRASNAVRRWELLQLEDQTQDMYETLIDELQSILLLDLSPAGVEKLAEDYYDTHNSTQVGMALHKDNKKMAELSIYQFVELHTRLTLHCIVMEFEILTKTTIKLGITLYVNTVH